MERSSKSRRGTRRAQLLPACPRRFLNPAVWRQARRDLPEPRKGTRWDFHHLDGIVTYWPNEARQKGLSPLRLRLIRVPGWRKAAGAKAGTDVWLLTNVTDRARLSADRAGRFYRLRWEN